VAVVAEDEDEEEVADTAADGEEESEVVVDAVEGVAPIPVDEVSINQEGEGVEAEKNFFFLLQRNTHTHTNTKFRINFIMLVGFPSLAKRWELSLFINPSSDASACILKHLARSCSTKYN